MVQLAVLLFAVAISVPAALAETGSLQIGVKHRPEICDTKATNGDYVGVHYVGKLTDGTEFDNSYNRGEPIEFQLGSNQVIPGWEQGILGMCAGEKRRLQIPPHLGYGDQGVGPIPGGATLVFDVELSYISAEPQQAGSDGYPGGYEDYPGMGAEEGYGGQGFGGLHEGGEDEEAEQMLGGVNFGDMRGYGEEDAGEAGWA